MGRTKEVLERLKAQEKKEKFKTPDFKKSSFQKDSANAPQSLYQFKLEKIVNRLNELERKMKSGDEYFTHYWDYSKISREFLEITKEFEKFDTSYVNPQFRKKIADAKLRAEAHLNRGKNLELGRK